MKIKWACFLLVSFSFALVGALAARAAAVKDRVTIIDVKTAKTEGSEATSYTVRVSYALISTPGGKVMLGFGSDQSKSYRMVSEKKVAPGAGEVELRADFAQPKESGVVVYVNLSADPHEKTWRPLASDKRALAK